MTKGKPSKGGVPGKFREVRDLLAKRYLTKRPRGMRPLPPPLATPDPGRNVVGVGIGHRRVGGKYTRELCVAIFVVKKMSPGAVPKRFRLPTEVRGVPIDVVEMGMPRALGAAPDGNGDPTFAPAQPGSLVSARYNLIPGGWIHGTLGAVVRVEEGTPVDESEDSSEFALPEVKSTGPPAAGTDFIVGCNHVFADENRAPLRSPILYPSVGDPDIPESEVIAYLDGFVPLVKQPACNRMDVAWARIARGVFVNPVFPPPIGELSSGVPLPVSEDDIGMPVEKYGGGTQYTTGTIRYLGSLTVPYYRPGGSPVWRDFEGQLIIGPDNEGSGFAGEGDSGAIVVHRFQKRPVAMLFAGATTGYATPLAPLFDLLKNLTVSIVTS